MLWPPETEETGGLQHASRLHEAQGKLILDLLKGGPNRTGPSAEAKAQPRHHRSGGAFVPAVLLKQGELWLDVSQRQLSDDDLLGILTDRFCQAVHDKASTSRSIAPDMWYLNIDVSQNRLTGRGISLLLDLFERLNGTFRAGGRPFIARILRLYKNHLGDPGALQVARFITVQRAPLHELHLSHNEIGQEGAEAILRAFGTHPTRSYPFQLLINKSLFGACWVRLEHNVIPDPSGLLKAIGELGVRITPTTDRRGGDFGPGRAPSWATSPDVVPHAVLSWQYHQVSAVAANRNPRGSTPQEQHAQQMAQDAATALNSAFLKGLLNPAPAASEGEDHSAARQRHPSEPQFSEGATEQRGLPAAAGPRIVGLQSPSGQQSAGGHGANKIGRPAKEDLDEAPAKLASSAPTRSQKGQIAARVKGALLAAQADTEGRGPPDASARPAPPPPIQTTTLLSTTPPDAPLTPERAQDAVRREPEGLRQAKEVVASLDTCNDGEVMGRWMQHLERSRDPMKEAEKIMKMLRCLVRQGFCASSADRQAARGVPTTEASASSQRSSRTSPRDPPGTPSVPPAAAEIISQLQRLAAQSHTPAPSMMAQRIPPAPLDSLGRPTSPAYTSPAGSMAGGILSTVPSVPQATASPAARGPVPVGKISPTGSQSNTRDGAGDIDMMAVLLKELADPRIASAQPKTPPLPPPK